MNARLGLDRYMLIPHLPRPVYTEPDDAVEAPERSATSEG